MIFCRARNFIFVHIHKCAGTSVTEALKPFVSSDALELGPPKLRERVGGSVGESQIALHKHSTATEICQVVGDDVWDSCYKFAFVRHPLDRLVSFYEFLERVRRNNESKPTLVDRLLGRARSSEVNCLPDQAPWSWPGMKALISTGTFSEFIRSDFLSREQGVNPQVRALTNGTGKLLTDFVGKYENLQEDWARVCSRLEITANLPNSNQSRRRHAGVGKYCTEDDKSFVRKKYAEDFELFSYSYSNS